MDGILVINKPQNWTSHDVVAKVRKIFKVKKVGHAGTLDPVATGVLVVMVGKKATKLSDKLRGQDKEYLVTIEFGRSTSTGDIEGEILEKLEPTDPKLKQITREKLQASLKDFEGEIEQTVPWFSAVKVQGQKLYKIARSHQEGQVERPRRKIKIYEIELLDFTAAFPSHPYPQAKLRVICSSGTYTRVLAEDIGKALGVLAYQTDLLRTRVGEYQLKQAVEIEKLAVCPNSLKYLLPL